MDASQQICRISGSGSESQGTVVVCAPAGGSGVITAYDEHGRVAFHIHADASGMNILNMTLQEGEYHLLYFSEPIGEGSQVYEGLLTVIA